MDSNCYKPKIVRADFVAGVLDSFTCEIFGHLSVCVYRSQGGCVAHVWPEHLLEPRDYRQWVKTQSSSDRPDGEPNAAVAVDDNVFESLSKRAWMDVLLQLIKVGISLRFDCAIFTPPP